MEVAEGARAQLSALDGRASAASPERRDCGGDDGGGLWLDGAWSIGRGPPFFQLFKPEG